MDSPLDDAPCAFFLLDADAHLIRTNRLFCDWLGYPPETLDGAAFAEVLTGAGRVYFGTYIQPLLELQDEIRETYLTFESLSGHPVPMLTKLSRRDGETGPEYVGMAMLVTEPGDERGHR